MTWDELEMVTLRKTTDNRWSFTVYADGFRMICSNRGLTDAFECIEQIINWLPTEPLASGGMRSKPAGVPQKVEVTKGELDDQPMQLAVKKSRPRKTRRCSGAP